MKNRQLVGSFRTARREENHQRQKNVKGRVRFPVEACTQLIAKASSRYHTIGGSQVMTDMNKLVVNFVHSKKDELLLEQEVYCILAKIHCPDGLEQSIKTLFKILKASQDRLQLSLKRSMVAKSKQTLLKNIKMMSVISAFRKKLLKRCHQMKDNLEPFVLFLLSVQKQNLSYPFEIVFQCLQDGEVNTKLKICQKLFPLPACFLAKEQSKTANDHHILSGRSPSSLVIEVTYHHEIAAEFVQRCTSFISQEKGFLKAEIVHCSMKNIVCDTTTTSFDHQTADGEQFKDRYQNTDPVTSNNTTKHIVQVIMHFRSSAPCQFKSFQLKFFKGNTESSNTEVSFPSMLEEVKHKPCQHFFTSAGIKKKGKELFEEEDKCFNTIFGVNFDIDCAMMNHFFEKVMMQQSGGQGHFSDSGSTPIHGISAVIEAQLLTLPL